MKKKKILIITLIVAMIACLGTYSAAFAETKAEKEDKMEEIENQKDEISNTLSDLSDQLSSQQEDIDKVQAQVNSKQSQLNETQAEIDKTEADIEKRKNGLDTRLRTMYKNGSIGYLDILLGSNSVSEFISNLELVQKIYKGDQDTLNSLKDQQKILQENESKLKTEKEELDQVKADLESKKAEVQKTKDSMQAQYDELDKELKQIASEISKLEAAQGSANLPKSYGGGVFQWPCNSHYITSWFGNRPASDTNGIGSTNHGGIDIGAGSGTPIYACASGTVIMSSWFSGYGNCVQISHGSGLVTLYGHCSSLAVSAGQHVKKGQVIAYVGSTGNSTGPHLHLSVFLNGVAVDPMNYL